MLNVGTLLSLITGTLISGVAFTFIAGWVFRRWGRSVRNFQGLDIPTGYGVYILAWAAAGSISGLGMRVTTLRQGVSLVLVVCVMGILGFVDDVVGSHGGGGLTGHFRVALYRKKLTTGAFKAIGGGLASLIAAWLLIAVPFWWTVVMNGAIIALSANFINLLDLRPGRAGSVFLFCWCISASFMLSSPLVVLTLPAALATIFLLRGDRRGYWIMGDAGSNVLGAILGVMVVAGFSLAGRTVVLILLVAVHLFAEKRSLSKVIEDNRLLSSIDRKLGIR